MKEIKLTRGKVALVDDKDYVSFSSFRWRASETKSGFYAVRQIYISKYKTKPCFLHRLILGEPEGLIVDHINGDSLDNRRKNLRTCTHQQNIANRKISKNNTTGFKGVVRDRKGFRAEIKVWGKKIHLGSYKNPIDAAHSYDLASKKYFKNFARPNFV